MTYCLYIHTRFQDSTFAIILQSLKKLPFSSKFSKKQRFLRKNLNVNIYGTIVLYFHKCQKNSHHCTGILIFMFLYYNFGIFLLEAACSELVLTLSICKSKIFSKSGVRNKYKTDAIYIQFMYNQISLSASALSIIATRLSEPRTNKIIKT